MQQYKQEWFGNIRGDILAGIVVCLALFPEVIGFMIVAGVPPIVGVYATFFITAIAAFFGSSKGMISAAAGSVALVLAHLVAEYGIQYLFAATILAGILQVALGFIKGRHLDALHSEACHDRFRKRLGDHDVHFAIGSFPRQPAFAAPGSVGNRDHFPVS